MISCHNRLKTHIVHLIFLFFFSMVLVPSAHPAHTLSHSPDQAMHDTQAPLPQLQYSRDDAYTSMAIVKSLEKYHYSGKKLNDLLSANILDKYLSNIDPARNLFTAKDINEFEQVKYWLDNSLERGNLNPGYVIFNVYLQRSMQRLQYIKSLIPGWEQRFDFTKKEFISLDRENEPWPETMAALKTLWYRELKNDLLTQKLDGIAPDEITTLLEKRYHNRQTRLAQIDEKDVFSSYMNAVTMCFDPHTQYFPPPGF